MFLEVWLVISCIVKIAENDNKGYHFLKWQMNKIIGCLFRQPMC